MEDQKTSTIRCRAIIIDDGQLLLVRHASHPEIAVLPGGHLDWGEDVRTCLKRELLEEIGIAPEIGRLLYVHSFVNAGVHTTEFLLEVTNGAAYRNPVSHPPSHAHEIAEVIWESPHTLQKMLPEKVAQDFKAGIVLQERTRFIDTA